MGAADPFKPAAVPSNPPHASPADSSLTVIHPGDPRRAAAEALVRSCFRETYGARVGYFLPSLLTLFQPPRGPQAVLGFGSATGQPLFLEHYLEVPIQEAVARVSGRAVARADMVEVGNLAVAFPGGARCLAVALTAFLAARGAGWVAFTARTALRNTFERLGIALHPLAEARADRLPGGGSEWGRYYDDGPLVVAARVRQGAAAVRSRLPDRDGLLAAMWAQGQALGVSTRGLPVGGVR